MSSPRSSPTPAAIVSRVAAAVPGGWLFTWGFAALCITLGVALGQPFEEAETMAMLLAFLVYLTVFCWAFAAADLRRVWGVLVGGGLLMTALAWGLQRALI